ncbi:MAG: hypothetical protein IJU76_12525 [Desulfovibrionaceae bacterium]|nr:hypothetical protein [Desulfovibrionaceae bacterium]
MGHTSFFDSVYLFFVTRTSGEYFLLSLIILLPLFFFLGHLYTVWRAKEAKRKQKLFVMQQLELAYSQIETFSIQVGERDTRTNYMAILDSITNDFLTLSITEYMSPLWINQKADFFFCVRRDAQRDFYRFRAPILSLKPSGKTTKIRVPSPNSLEMGQKRAFFRITPLPETIRVIAIWLLSDTAHLPKATSDVGKPYMSVTFKDRKDEKVSPLNVEDISGTGIALRIILKNQDEELLIEKGKQILCLLVYDASLQKKEHLVNFCCTGRVTNVRSVKNAFIVGAEFENWALLNRGKPTINWFKQQKAVGIGPILNWVTKMDLERHKILASETF